MISRAPSRQPCLLTFTYAASRMKLHALDLVSETREVRYSSVVSTERLFSRRTFPIAGSIRHTRGACSGTLVLQKYFRRSEFYWSSFAAAHAAFTPKISLTNRTCPTTSFPDNHLTCPFRIICTAS